MVIKSQGKRGKKEERNKKGTTKTIRKQQNGNNYIFSNNYFKYKWINIPIKRHRVAKWVKKNKTHYNLPTRGSLQI